MSAESRRTRSIIACIVAMTTVTVTLGLSWPLLAIVLDKQGVSPFLNGISASSQMLAVLAIAPMGPSGMPLISTILCVLFLILVISRIRKPDLQ